MNEESPNIFDLLSNWWRKRKASETSSPWEKWLPSRGNVVFTLLVIGLFFWAQQTGALPGQAATTSSTNTISYQGRLADAAGDPLTGVYNLEFRIYDVPTGGAPLWEELWTGGNSVQISDGLFNVMLGSLNPNLATAIEGQSELYLGITVGTDSEMVPRVQLGSVPFAMFAEKLASRGSGLIQVWNHDTIESFDALGSVSTRTTFDTGIDVTVPDGSTQYYLISYQGIFSYQYADRNGTPDSFYGQWNAKLVDGVNVLDEYRAALTGYRMKWDAVGGNWYWNHPFTTSWIIELGPGTHNLDIEISGYSDNSMTFGRIGYQKMEVIPLP